MNKKLRAGAMVLACMAAIHVLPAFAAEFEDIGRVGEPTRIADVSTLRVCSDKENMPFTNEKLEGFENRIADLIAQDLGRKVEYYFGFDRMGYIRTTLNAHMCDVILGTVSGNDMMLTTKPYYRTSYVFVYKKNSGLNIKDWDSPDLHKAKIGTVDYAPTTRPLTDKGLLGNVVPYHITHDADHPSSEMIDDLVKGKIDVAIIWGPIGGYYAKQQASADLVVAPCPEYEQVNVHGKEAWNISMGVRRKDKAMLETLQSVLDRRQADILKILDDYGVPHIPVVAETIQGVK